MWLCINVKRRSQGREGGRDFKFSISVGIRVFQCSLRNESLNSLVQM